MAGIALVAAAGLTGCGGLGVGSPGSPIVASDSWTILTYEIADTNLEPDMMNDVEEMGQVGTRPGLNLVSFVDRAEGYTDTPVLGLPDWTGAKLLEVEPGGSATVLGDYGPQNTGDPDLLADVMREVFAAYPAANYGLIISDHGASWPGVGDDESSGGDSLTLSEIEQGISSGLEQAGVPKLQLLGFDACLMATFEVASTLQPYADYLVASQETEPGHGWDYTSLEAAYRGATAPELGSAIIDGFSNQAAAEGTNSNITLSLIDLTNFGEVDDAVTAFAKALTDRVADVAPTVGRTLAETLGFGTSPDPRYDTHMKDLGILAGEISVDALDVADQADDVVRAVNDVVLDSVTGQQTRGATGLSIYFPPTGDLYDDAYTAVAERTGWSEFLSTYYGQGTAIPDDLKPAFTTDTPGIDFADGGTYITGQFQPGAEAYLSSSTVYFGVSNDDGSIVYLGEKNAQIGSGVAQGFYDGYVLSLGDGTNSALAYLSLTDASQSGSVVSINVPISYTAPGASDYTDGMLTLGLDTASGTVVSSIFYGYNPDSGTYGELTTDPAGTLEPLLSYYDASTDEFGWTVSDPISADISRLVYSVDPVPSGTPMVLELWITDFGGNSDFLTANYPAP